MTPWPKIRRTVESRTYTPGGTIMKALVFLIGGGFFAAAVGGVVGVAIFVGMVVVFSLFAAAGNSTTEAQEKKVSDVAVPAATGVAAGAAETFFPE